LERKAVGYSLKIGKKIVPPEHTPEGSHARTEQECTIVSRTQENLQKGGDSKRNNGREEKLTPSHSGQKSDWWGQGQ